MLRHLMLYSCLIVITVGMTMALVLPTSAAEVSVATMLPSERSIYLLDSNWRDDNGRSVKLRALAGHYQVLGFIFTKCAGACPLLVKTMQHHTRAMPADVRKRTRLLLVTIDPEHDTPSVLHRYRREMRLPAGEWMLLRGNAADVRELAAVVGFNYARGEDGMFVHSNLVTLLDPGGEVVFQHAGGSSDWSAMADTIATLAARLDAPRTATAD